MTRSVTSPGSSSRTPVPTPVRKSYTSCASAPLSKWMATSSSAMATSNPPRGRVASPRAASSMPAHRSIQVRMSSTLAFPFVSIALSSTRCLGTQNTELGCVYTYFCPSIVKNPRPSLATLIIGLPTFSHASHALRSYHPTRVYVPTMNMPSSRFNFSTNDGNVSGVTGSLSPHSMPLPADGNFAS